MTDQKPNLIPADELTFEFARSSGPGGQKVNKTESKVWVRWHVGRSKAFSDEQKQMVREHLGNRMNKYDELVLSSEEERSQVQNRERVTARLNDMVGGAIIPPKIRKKTKPSRAAKEKRLTEKKIVSSKKTARKLPNFE